MTKLMAPQLQQANESRVASPANATARTVLDRDGLKRRIEQLGEWFHNLDLHGVETAPNHFLGDFPNIKWKYVSPEIPADLGGARVLDIGCNGGFYCIQMKKRGAERVLGIDVDDRYLNQARFAAEQLNLNIEFQKLSVYDVDKIPGQFDYVLFMGLFYHLRYPLYALDKIIQKVRGKLLFQTMIRGSETPKEWDSNYQFWNKEVFHQQGFPCMYFIEHRYANDPTNWWLPNASAAEAILRSSGMEIVSHPETETWICVPKTISRDGRFIQDMELDGTL